MKWIALIVFSICMAFSAFADGPANGRITAVYHPTSSSTDVSFMLEGQTQYFTLSSGYIFTDVKKFDRAYASLLTAMSNGCSVEIYWANASDRRIAGFIVHCN